MILAAGLTPAWQQILLLDQFHVGEVNRARAVHACASGKVLNVALALHALDAPVGALSLLGGLNGDRIRAEFEQLGMRTRWIVSRTPTRVCTTLLDAGSGTTTELVENSAAVDPAELAAWRTAFGEESRSAGVVVLTGSLPQGAPAGFYREVLCGCPARVILDARGPELLEALDTRPFLVKPNREELARTLGRPVAGAGELREAMRELVRRGAQAVLVSDGSRALHLLTAAGARELVPPRVPRVVNPIGSGDCLAAGVAWGLERGLSLQEAVRWGVAAAADNVGELLPARLERSRLEHWHGQAQYSSQATTE